MASKQGVIYEFVDIPMDLMVFPGKSAVGIQDSEGVWDLAILGTMCGIAVVVDFWLPEAYALLLQEYSVRTKFFTYV